MDAERRQQLQAMLRKAQANSPVAKMVQGMKDAKRPSVSGMVVCPKCGGNHVTCGGEAA